eukprot:365102-Chlamydomonas_euryale.AAC.12
MRRQGTGVLAGMCGRGQGVWGLCGTRAIRAVCELRGQGAGVLVGMCRRGQGGCVLGDSSACWGIRFLAKAGLGENSLKWGQRFVFTKPCFHTVFTKQ